MFQIYWIKNFLVRMGVNELSEYANVEQLISETCLVALKRLLDDIYVCCVITF